MKSDKVKDFNKDLKFKFFGDIDEIIDEKGSQYIAVRKTAWYSGDATPSEEKAKLEIRKWQVTDGESQQDSPRRGVSFLTPEGPHNLAEALVKHNFGNTKTLLNVLKERDNFRDSVQHMYDEDDQDAEDFFDARDSLLLEA